MPGMDLSGLKAMGLGPSLEAPGDAKLDPERRKLKAVAREFEAIMVGQIFTAMRATHKSADPLNKGQANQIFRDMMDQQLGREMARRESLGIADDIYRELVRNLPAAPKVEPTPPQPSP